ncbi:MAG: M28 family peptidase [Bacteroidales bacterium]|jgi:hypothetical protein|nr:M28 family peptidase [Bacteroidales bacterium]MDX9795626.1 M28 family peptidase [Arcobacteraceae bacterium]
MTRISKNIKNIASELWKTKQEKRYIFLRNLLSNSNIKFFEQHFNNGINFIVGDFLRCNTVVSSHYDGPGMYDNAVGCIILIHLMLDNFSDNICFALFDQEEIGCIGAKSFFSENNNFINHIDIGGCGIGNELIFKKPNESFIFKHKGTNVVLPFYCDANISANYGINSWHLFFLNSNDKKSLNNMICPKAFYILHDERDNQNIISNKYTINNLNYLRYILHLTEIPNVKN